MSDQTTKPTTASTPRTYRRHLQRAKDEKPPLVIKPRDIDFLRVLWDHRFLTRELLLRLFPPDPEKTPAHKRTEAPKAPGSNLEKRLAKLFHHGYVDRFRTVVRGELVYALGQAGAALLRDRQLNLPFLDTDWTQKNRQVTALFVEHTLMVARFRTALALGAAKSSGLTVDVSLPESRAPRASWSNARTSQAYVNPDAFVILRETDRPGDAQRSAFFVEADRSTMALKRLRQKYAFYSALRSDRRHQEAPFEIPGFRVLTVCKSNDRALSLLRLVADSHSTVPPGHRAMFLFTTEETYAEHPENVLAAIWRDAGDPQQPRALIGSPLPRQ
jgi:hypothetical protein